MPITAVSASSSGSPAATSAPNATIRISSVIGSERNSAFLKSLSNALLSALSALRVAELLDPQLRVRALGAAVAASDASTRVLGDVVVAGELEGDERGAAVAGRAGPALPLA